MNSRKNTIEQTIKYVLLALCVFVLYVLQGTPGFLQIFGVRPIFIIPFCINLAMLEEDEHALIIYVIAGILMELSAGRIVGMYTIPLIIACIICTILVKFVFQPAEENNPVGGAPLMIKEGVLENPRVDNAIALHVWDYPTGTIAVKPQAMMSESNRIFITIKEKLYR